MDVRLCHTACHVKSRCMSPSAISEAPATQNDLACNQGGRHQVPRLPRKVARRPEICMYLCVYVCMYVWYKTPTKWSCRRYIEQGTRHERRSMWTLACGIRADFFSLGSMLIPFEHRHLVTFLQCQFLQCSSAKPLR